jgi:tRNA pseudouridine38-40 synthase
MRVKLTVEYDGTNYAGWQRQTNGLSVQEALERAFEAASGEHTVIHGAGRTDAGVHAMAQVAHLDTQCSIPAEKICFAMNMHLPPDIRVKQSEKADEDFHARFSAKGKHYRYTIYNAMHAPAIHRHTAAHIRGKLDIDVMCEAAGYIVGMHDFACFCASGSEVKDTVRTVYSLDIHQEGPFIIMDIKGSGFLYHMVRIIAGTLIEIGQKKRRPLSMKDIIGSKDREQAGVTAPAKGLMMMEVYYDEGDIL